MTGKQALISLFLTTLLLPCRAAAGSAVSFPALPYPVRADLQAAYKLGSVVFETPFSAPFTQSYDTVVLQGEMPDPGAGIEVVVKSKVFFAPSTRYASEAFRRFPGGRFWARYRVPLSRQPLQLSVVNGGLQDGASLTIYETEAFQAAEEVEPLPQPATGPYVPDPDLYLPAAAPFKLIRRADWQAAPPTEPYTPHAPAYFTLHHTQAHYPATYERAVAEMQFIQDFHQNGRGWIDIAYHFLIDPAGNIFEGRPIKVLGAHVKNRNTANIGISVMGNFHPPANNDFTPAAKDSFVAIGAYLRDTYEVRVSSFYAHRDIGNTDCPGDLLYARKDQLRDLIFTPAPQGLPADPAAAPAPTPAQQESLRQLLRYLDRP